MGKESVTVERDVFVALFDNSVVSEYAGFTKALAQENARRNPQTHLGPVVATLWRIRRPDVFEWSSCSAPGADGAAMPCVARDPSSTIASMKELVIFVAFAAFILVARLAIKQGHR